MFKRFLFQTLSSFTGAVVALVIGGVVLAAIVGGMMASLSGGSEQEEPKMKKGSVLMLKLEGDIQECEKPFSPDFTMLASGNFDAPQSLKELTASLREAAVNKDIVAIYLKCGSLIAAPATLDALRDQLIEFKKTTKGEKPLYAYADDFSQGSYYVASVADSIFMNPEGSFALRGMATQNFYFKNLLDKVGVKIQIAKVGTYKSAVEPFILDHMSVPARAQLDTMLTNMWGYITDKICASRAGLTREAIDSLINRDHISFARADLAARANLVDGLLYDREIKTKLSRASGCQVEHLNLVPTATLMAKVKPADKNYDAKRQIAVLYAVGSIDDGNESEIDYNKFVPIIDRLADDERVKALVLRVNSPGGSVYGSAQIGEALDFFAAQGKPVIVSMGDYAASGGYWISAKAKRIFADPLTLTGSIGIFGMFPCVEETAKMLGVNVDMVATDPEATFPNLFAPLTAEQQGVLQEAVNRGYDQFVARVAEGRHMSEAHVRQIAEGRVWDGQKALQIGLVDELGSLQQAIAYAAKAAAVDDDYELAAYPEYNPSLFDMIMTGGVSAGELKSALKARDTAVIEQYILNRILSRNRVQAHMGEFSVRM